MKIVDQNYTAPPTSATQEPKASNETVADSTTQINHIFTCINSLLKNLASQTEKPDRDKHYSALRALCEKTLEKLSTTEAKAS